MPRFRQAERRPTCSPVQSIFACSAAEMAAHYNRKPFAYRHTLAPHPLLQLPRLRRLAAHLEAHHAEKVSFYSGDARVDQRWNMAPSGAASAADAMDRIHESGTWILLKCAQLDPEYGFLLREILAEIALLSGRPLAREVSWADLYVFISSPGSLTPFHIDHEVNFLFQAHGRKTAHVSDPADRLAVTEEEIEGYYVGEMNAATYRKEREARALVTELAPGCGVHQPSLAGHWMTTGPEYSITLSVNYCTREIDRRALTHQFNHYLRLAGRKPLPVGCSALGDGVKAFGMGAMALQFRPASKYHLLRRGVIRIEALRRRVGRGRPEL
jgi:hypothetical protein